MFFWTSPYLYRFACVERRAYDAGMKTSVRWRYRLARLLVGPLRVDRQWFDQKRCSWCELHDFACGGDVHAVANAAMADCDPSRGRRSPA
jgi:hypothetical protein